MSNPSAVIIPNELDVRLMFIDQINVGAAGTFANYTLNPNCPFDVDPAFGSTSTAGFAELAALFQFQRTVAYAYDISMVNQCGAAAPAQFTILNVNVAPAAGAAYALAGNQFAQTRTAVAASQSGSICRFKAKHTVAEIVGSKTPETADSYASLTNAVPTDKIFLIMGITNIVAGIASSYAMVQLEMWIRFYERKNLTS